jgi:type IV pilus secretin PilQ/predicted competence protein
MTTYARILRAAEFMPGPCSSIIQIANGSGDRMTQLGILANMHKLGVTPLLAAMVGLSVFTVGCVRDGRMHSRDSAFLAAARPVPHIQTTDSDSTADTHSSDSQTSVVRNLAPCPASGGELKEEQQETASSDVSSPKDDQDAVQPAQFQSTPIEVVQTPQAFVAEEVPSEPEAAAASQGAEAEKKPVNVPPPPGLPGAPTEKRAVEAAAQEPEGNAAEKKPVEVPPPPAPLGTVTNHGTAEKTTADKKLADKASVETAKPAKRSVADPLITLHVDNLEVSKAIEMISRQAKILNILVSPGVTGNVTVDIRDKTVDETLEIIARQCRLKVRRDKDVIYVSTVAESRLVEEDDLPVHVYHLNYVKSGDIEKIVKPLLSKVGKFTGTPESLSGLATDITKAGESKAVESGGNSMAGGDIIVIQDYEYVLKKLDRVIAELDVQPIQVLIEAVIVQVRLDKGMELGANFAVLDGANRAVGVVGSGAIINSTAGFTPASVLTAGGLLRGSLADGLNSVTPGLKFGWTGGSTTGFIKALESYGEVKILASPRILVLNKQRADIHLGDRLGYFTTTQTQTSTVQTVQYQDVGTQLRLRPFVSSDGIIRMEVRPERSSGALDSQGIPQVNSTAITTNIMIPNGATLVIGGLIDTEVQTKWNGIPLLSRLPWIGYLFRETEDDMIKKELVVILTPRIWRPECPEGTNYVGPPRTLGLKGRVAQTPCEENRDGPTMFETVRPEGCPPNGPVPPGAVPLESRRPVQVRR